MIVGRARVSLEPEHADTLTLLYVREALTKRVHGGHAVESPLLDFQSSGTKRLFFRFAENSISKRNRLRDGGQCRVCVCRYIGRTACGIPGFRRG